MFNFNFLGIAFIGEEVPKKKAEQVENKMQEIIERHKELAQAEFDEYLASKGLESAMGVVIKIEKARLKTYD
ncbi:hypothetical protein [Paenibacillus agilis]|uniref:Uncharacterized protein n=1 Tax=Paenibacillus agilis TaxID=3020863 RepID=A0A559IEW3_9BACL|nr:hypothetical protein [Paenibacillus agilis]TVX86050.1 hypothetical protein FPZ44_24215 [Paenibacillus agilis]